MPVTHFLMSNGHLPTFLFSIDKRLVLLYNYSIMGILYQNFRIIPQGGKNMRRYTRVKKTKKASPKTAVKVLGVGVVCVYVACTLAKQQITLSKNREVAEEYRTKIAEAQKSNQKLEDELKQAGTDEYLERIAREKLGLVKANERVFIDITKQ